jgi:hypothetical protein
MRSELEWLLSAAFVWVDHDRADRVLNLCAGRVALHAPGIDLDLGQFEQVMALRAAATAA